jgi:hypothetical protein
LWFKASLGKKTWETLSWKKLSQKRAGGLAKLVEHLPRGTRPWIQTLVPLPHQIKRYRLAESWQSQLQSLCSLILVSLSPSLLCFAFLLRKDFIFGSTGFELRAWCSLGKLYHLSRAPFPLVIFWVRFWIFAQARLGCHSPCVAGMIDVYPHAQIFIHWDGFLLKFFPGWPQTTNLPEQLGL